MQEAARQRGGEAVANRGGAHHVRANDAVAAILARVSLFATLQQPELAALAGRVRRRHYPKGAYIFVEGDAGNALYVIERGHVQIGITSPEGKELVVTRLGPGEFFGDLALLDGEPRSADALAAEDCWLLLLERDDFVGVIERHPRAALRLLEVVGRRLRRLTRQQQESTLLDTGGRIAAALLRLAEEGRAPAAARTASVSDAVTAPVTVAVTQRALAGQVGVTRESVNKWLRIFQQRGLLRCEKGSITVLQPHRLRSWRF